MLNDFRTAAMLDEMTKMLHSFGDEVISGGVRMRALLELMEEKGLLGPGEFDERAAAVWERDYDDLAAELSSQIDESIGLKDHDEQKPD